MYEDRLIAWLEVRLFHVSFPLPVVSINR